MKVVKGDEAFYYNNLEGKLVGMIITHVDDFSIAGRSDFIDSVLAKVKEELTVSKVERNQFRFTGVDISKTEEGIKMSMNEYAESLEDLDEIKKAENDEKLTKQELKVFRKFI